jgi:aminoglycoside/choline kinase family phosphotransferase
VFHADLAQGLLLIEDLGDDRVVSGDPPAPIEECYAAAVDLLAILHCQNLPPTLPAAQGIEHRIPRYDIGAFLIEAELLLDWYMPHMHAAVSASTRDVFVALWREALQPAIDAPPTWVLRDFHSPNLLWLPDRKGVARVGLLDFQDALLGPAAYDLASLLQDARVDVPEAMEIALIGRYVRSRREADAGFDVAAFARLYATMAAQRATKVLGIFARLNRRDGKPQYLRHMPRIWAYLQRALAHPALAQLYGWYKTHAPEPSARKEQP